MIKGLQGYQLLYKSVIWSERGMEMKKQRWRITKVKKCCVCKGNVDTTENYGICSGPQNVWYWCNDCMLSLRGE